MVVLGDRREERQADVRPRRLLQQPGRLTRACAADDHATVRIGRGGRRCRPDRARRCCRPPCGASVDGPDGQIGRHAVQIFFRRVATLCEHRFVVADAEHVLVLRPRGVPAGRAAPRPYARSIDVVPAGGGARSTQSSSPATCVKCPCPSTKPGTSVLPPMSTRRAPPPAAPSTRRTSPTASIRPLRTATASARGLRSSIVTTSAFTNTAVDSRARPASLLETGTPEPNAQISPRPIRAGHRKVAALSRFARERLVVRERPVDARAAQREGEHARADRREHAREDDQRAANESASAPGLAPTSSAPRSTASACVSGSSRPIARSQAGSTVTG